MVGHWDNQQSNMNLENQVCSLDLANRLKELGVKQESLFWWIAPEDNEKWPPMLVFKTGLGAYYENGAGLNDYTFDVAPLRVSAFTVAELGEMLPKIIQEIDWWSVKTVSKDEYKRWLCALFDTDAGGHDWKDPSFYANTEADARAKMLIYLLENNLMTI
jgi:hypothetical protein